MKNYLNDVICACSEHQFGQDAVEHAILTGQVKLAYDLAGDVRAIMSQYDAIVENYQREINRNEEVLAESYGPLLADILHPVGPDWDGKPEDAEDDPETVAENNRAAAACVGSEDHEDELRNAA